MRTEKELASRKLDSMRVKRLSLCTCWQTENGQKGRTKRPWQPRKFSQSSWSLVAGQGTGPARWQSWWRRRHFGSKPEWDCQTWIPLTLQLPVVTVTAGVNVPSARIAAPPINAGMINHFARFLTNGVKGKNSAFAVVISAHGNYNVFDRRDDH